MKDLKVCFMGTPNFSVPVLKMLYENTNLVLVVSRPDALVGRKKILTPSDVSIFALENNIPLLRLKNIKEEYESILKYEPDIIITCAYGQIVPKQLLDYPKYGCINVHASLLPKYRGASPINAAIKNGDKKTGITIMYMEETLDTGNIISSKKIDILDDDTLQTLSDKLSLLGSELLKETLPKIISGENESIKQNESDSSYVGMIKRIDEFVDFNNSVVDVYNHIRSMIPEPYVTVVINNEEWKLIEAHIGKKAKLKPGIINEVYKDCFSITCLDGEIIVTKVKRPGKNIMSVKDLFNGYDKNLLLNKKVGEPNEEKK